MDNPPGPTLGREVASHFRIRRAGRTGFTPIIGQLGWSTARFGSLVGRSMSGRHALGHAAMVPARPTTGLAVRLPDYPMLAAFWESQASGPVASKGLRRATGLRGLTSAGPGTTPASFSQRLAPKVVPIRPPAEVRAAGPMSAPRPTAAPAAPRPGTGRATPAPRPTAAPAAPRPGTGRATPGPVDAGRGQPRLPAALTRADRGPGGGAGGPTASRWGDPSGAGAGATASPSGSSRRSENLRGRGFTVARRGRTETVITAPARRPHMGRTTAFPLAPGSPGLGTSVPSRTWRPEVVRRPSPPSGRLPIVDEGALGPWGYRLGSDPRARSMATSRYEILPSAAIGSSPAVRPGATVAARAFAWAARHDPVPLAPPARVVNHQGVTAGGLVGWAVSGSLGSATGRPRPRPGDACPARGLAGGGPVRYQPGGRGPIRGCHGPRRPAPCGGRRFVSAAAGADTVGYRPASRGDHGPAVLAASGPGATGRAPDGDCRRPAQARLALPASGPNISGESYVRRFHWLDSGRRADGGGPTGMVDARVGHARRPSRRSRLPGR